jgi:hypothetical protein
MLLIDSRLRSAAFAVPFATHHADNAKLIFFCELRNISLEIL